MKHIYKYTLPFGGSTTTITAPIEKILTIQNQFGNPVMWAIVDSKLDDKTITVIAIGTGWEIPEGIDKYLGTIQDSDGFVWHYFVYNLQEMLKAPIEEEQKILFDEFAVLAQVLGKTGATMEETIKQFNMDGLFDACM